MGSGISGNKGTVEIKYELSQLQPRQKGKGRSSHHATSGSFEASDTQVAKTELSKCSVCKEFRKCAPRFGSSNSAPLNLCAACTLRNAASIAGSGTKAALMLRNRIPQEWKEASEHVVQIPSFKADALGSNQVNSECQKPHRIRRAGSSASLDFQSFEYHGDKHASVHAVPFFNRQSSEPTLLLAHTATRKSEIRARMRRSHTPASGVVQESRRVKFEKGDEVVSLLSRQRHGTAIMEVGHRGRVVTRVEKGVSQSNLDRLLVQFSKGYDWALASHQLCSLSSLPAVLECGLPGGFQWGNRVRSLAALVVQGSEDTELRVGDEGIVVGPGNIPGKVAVRFKTLLGELSLWPGLLCTDDKYEESMGHILPGGFLRGEHVRPQKHLQGRKGGCSSAHVLAKGQGGVVTGPGHVAGRLLVRFGIDVGSFHWSLLPSQLIRIPTIK